MFLIISTNYYTYDIIRNNIYTGGYEKVQHDNVNNSKLAKSAILMIILLFSSKGIGFIRELVLAYKFGTSYIVDAYTICTTLPSVVFTVYASGFSQSYVPMFARLKTGEQKNNFFSNVTNILLIVSFLLCICCFFGSNFIVSFMAPGFDERTKVITSVFIKIVVFVLPVMTIFNLLSAHLATKEDFIFANFCDHVVINVILIISILFATQEQSWILAGGYVISMLIAFILLLSYAIKQKKIVYKPYIEFGAPEFKALCTMALPLGLSLLVNQLNTVIDRIFSSTLGEGITSSLNYADKVQSIFLTLTTSIFLTVCYPRINKHFALGDNENGMYYIKKAFSIAIFTSIPLVAILVIYCVPIVRILFEKGEFTKNATLITAKCLAFYSLGIPFYAFREIMTKTLAANEKQKNILKNTIITVLSNILFNLLFIRTLGYVGLALATSLAGMVAFIIMSFELNKYKLRIFDTDILQDFIKILFATVIAVGISFLCRFIFNILFHRQDLSNIVAIIVSGVAYITVSFLVKVDIIYWLYSKLPVSIRLRININKKVDK